MFLIGAVEQSSPFFAVWDQLYGPFRLGLDTEVRLWFQFHILFNGRIFNFVGWQQPVDLSTLPYTL